MSIKIGTLMSIPIRLHYTLILAVLLIAWTVSFSLSPPFSSLEAWTIGVVGAIALFASVLIHELAHSYVAIKNGLPVKRIVLFIFGGVSEIEEEPKSAGVELKMALVGPASSLVIGSVIILVWYASTQLDLSPLIIAPLQYVGLINLLLGGFNLIPAFPTDGGRVLRAVLWKGKKNLVQATKTATSIGVAFSYLFMAGGLALIFLGLLINGLWFILIGWFLKNGAESSLRQTMVSEALAGVAVSDIMTRDVHTVEPDVPLKDLVEDYFSEYKHGGFPVAENSTLLGLVTIEDVKKIPKEKWPETKTAEAMTPCEKLTCLKADDSALEAFVRMSKQEIGRLPVREDGKLVGIISRSDILRAIKVRTELAS